MRKVHLIVLIVVCLSQTALLAADLTTSTSAQSSGASGGTSATAGSAPREAPVKIAQPRAVAGRAAVDVSGDWILYFTYAGSQGGNAPMHLNTDGTGVVSHGEYDGTDDTVTYTVSGSSITMTLSRIDLTQVAVYTGTVNGGMMSGTMAQTVGPVVGMPSGSGVWSAVRPPAYISAPTPYAGEGNSPTPGMFQVSISPAPAGDVTVNYTVDSSSTAVAGTDYVALPGSVVVPGGKGVATILVTPMNSFFTPNRTLVVNLSADNHYTLGTSSSATVTIGIAPTCVVFDSIAYVSGAAVIETPTLATGKVGLPFYLSMIGDLNPNNYTASGLPAGLSLDSYSGTISGTPTAAGEYLLDVSASNLFGKVNGSLSMTIFGPDGTPAATSGTTSNATGMVGSPFSFAATASNNPTGFTASGLPPGLTIDATTGIISGTPTQAGSFSAVWSATSAVGAFNSSLQITISAPVAGAPVFTSPQTANVIRLSPFSYTIAATNTPTGFTADGLPDGLSIDPVQGIVSGVPVSVGVFNVALSAVNASGTGTMMLTLTVIAEPNVAPVINSVSAQFNNVDVVTAVTGDVIAFNADASDANGDPLSFTWDYGDGSAGTGNASSHAFSTPGAFTVTLTVSDGQLSATATLNLTVLSAPSAGAGFHSVTQSDPPARNPLNGVAIEVTGSNGGIVDLAVDISALDRDAFGVSTDVASQTLSGKQITAQFTQHGIYVATSHVTRIATGVEEGKARKTIAIGARETDDDPVLANMLPPASTEIVPLALKGKFSFVKTSKPKLDTVAFSGTIILPVGFDHTKNQEFWVGIGNIVDRATVGPNGRLASKSDKGRIASVNIKYPAVAKITKKKAPATKPVPPANQATITVMLRAAGMSDAGFDTEGILPQLLPGEEKLKSVKRTIQVAMELAGTAYSASTPVEVNFTLSSKKDSGLISLGTYAKGQTPPMTRDQSVAMVQTNVLAQLPANTFAAYSPREMLQPGDVVAPAFVDDGVDPATVTLTVANPSWFFYVDESIGGKFSHPVKYILMDAASGKVTTVDTDWWPTINGKEIYSTVAELDNSADRFSPPFGQPRFSPSVLASARSIDNAFHPAASRGKPGSPPGTQRVAILVRASKENSCLTDVTKMDTFLTNSAGFTTVKTFTAPATTPKTTILTFISTTAATLGKGDQLLLYFSGHGTQAKVIYEDESATANLNDKSLYFNDVAQALAGTNVDHVDIIFDSCYSGAALRDFTNYLYDVFKSKPAAHVNVLTASDDSNESFFYIISSGSVYTGALLEALGKVNLDANGDGFISPDEFDLQLLNTSLVAAAAGDNYTTATFTGMPNAITATINGAVQFATAPPSNSGVAYTTYPFSSILYGSLTPGSKTKFGQGTPLGSPAVLHSQSTAGILVSTSSMPTTPIPDPSASGGGYGKLVTYIWTKNPPKLQYKASPATSGPPEGAK